MSLVQKDRRRSYARRFHRTVRNILFNELGVTRNSLEADIKRTIREACGDCAPSVEYIESQVEKIIDRHIYYHKGDLKRRIEERIDKAVREEVASRVKSILDERLTIVIGTAPGSGEPK